MMLAALAHVTNPYWPALPYVLILAPFYSVRRLLLTAVHRSWLSPTGFIRRCVQCDTFLGEASMALCLMALAVVAGLRGSLPAWVFLLGSTGLTQTIALAAQSAEGRVWTCLASFLAYFSLMLATRSAPPCPLFVVLGGVELLCFVHLVRYANSR